ADGRVAAAEQQDQRVVASVLVRVRGPGEQFGLRGGDRDLLFALATGLLAAHLVQQLPRRDRDQPAERVIRLAVGRPLHGGGEQGLLGRVLAQVELAVSVPAQQRAEDPRRELAQQVLDVGWRQRSSFESCGTGQISTGSFSAQGMSAAISSARSSLSTSSR